jgi:hypothetical protein
MLHVELRLTASVSGEMLGLRVLVCDTILLSEGVRAERVALGLDEALREADTDPVGV